jgi:carboxymethylenebutenolidase
MAGLCSEQARHPPEDRSVGHARSSRRERPGMGGLVPQRVLLLAFRQVSRDRDAVWSPVLDLASSQLAPGKLDTRRTEVETPRKAVVQELQPSLRVRGCNREEQFQLEIRLAASRACFDGARGHFLEDPMLRRLSFLSVSALLLTTALPAQSAGKMVSFPSGPETGSGYLAAPGGAGKRPAIVVIQEWWGLNDFVKGKADHFAKEGYVALAPDLYRGKVATDADTAHQLMRGLPEDRAIRDLKGAVALLRSRSDVDPKRIGGVGWCMGGGYSLSLALAEPTLAGAVIYYGRLVTDDAAIRSLQVPLLGNFGGQDQGISPESVREFERKARAAGKGLDFKIYTDAGHGFASSTDPKTYRTDDARDADARAHRFFEKTLKGK